MAFATTTINSSLIGANLNTSDATALFARGTTVVTTNGSRFEYVEASGTFTTGYMVMVSPGGTAWGYTTAMMTQGIAGVAGQDMGWVQGLVNRSEFGWVAKQGRDIYVLCTGTLTAGSTVGVAVASTGRLRNQPSGEAGSTMIGVYITTSASTGTASVAVATITWPSPIARLTAT
jgi:hypothetical protein